MAQIEVVMTIRDFSGKLYEQLSKLFYNATLPYEIFHTKLSFKPLIKREYETLNLNTKHTKKVTDIYLSLYSDMVAEIDMDDNSILYYDGPTNFSPSEISARKLRKYIKRDVLDDDFAGQMDLLCLRIVHAIILTMPWIDIYPAQFTIYLNNKKFRNEDYITNYPIHVEAYEKWKCLFNSKLSILQTWNWLRQNNIHETSKTNCPAATLLSFLFNREYHEIMLYSVIGLEALYCKKNQRNISSKLKNKIHNVFPVVSEEQIGKIYKARSKLAHGESKIGPYNLLLDLLNGNFMYVEEAVLSSAIFIETIRMLIANNAVKMNFVNYN